MTATAGCWHPSRSLLELVELIVDGALPQLPEVLALLGDADLAALAVRVDPGHPLPVDPTGPTGPTNPTGPSGPSGDGPVLIEDAEGTPVARLVAGRLTPERPFTHPPLRAHRRSPGAVREAADLGPALVAVVRGLPPTAEVDAAVAEAAGSGLALLWLVVVGAGRGPLPAEAAWRAARSLVERAGASGVRSCRVAAAIPMIEATGGAAAVTAPDPLPARVAAAWARHLGGGTRLLSDAVDPAFVQELVRAAVPAHRRGVTVFFTGLSGSGKSTIARALTARLAERGRRAVTLLDGDEVRRLLSAGLGFSRQDRDLNIRRIGFVAAEVCRHGGVAICAPIAPFAQVRAQVRAAVEEAGGELVLIHVATPLAECERRDRKGLYARARRGEIPDFTGISSPYEAPDDADLRLDTSREDVAGCVERVWSLLAGRGYLEELGPDRPNDRPVRGD